MHLEINFLPQDFAGNSYFNSTDCAGTRAIRRAYGNSLELREIGNGIGYSTIDRPVIVIVNGVCNDSFQGVNDYIHHGYTYGASHAKNFIIPLSKEEEMRWNEYQELIKQKI